MLVQTIDGGGRVADNQYDFNAIHFHRCQVHRMNRLAIPLTLLLVASGCKNRSDADVDDMPRLTQIDRAFLNRDFDSALPQALNYVEDYPRSCQGWSLLGWIYLETDEHEKANDCFDKSLNINPKWDNAYVAKGVMYRKDGDNERARQSYLKAISIVPDNAEAYSSLLVIELINGNDQMAVEYGEKAWALRKDLPSIPANLAMAYHYLGNHAKRDRYYQDAERLGYARLQTLKDVFEGRSSIR
jgi:tetratricopeptide (TPR) repeat protein